MSDINGLFCLDWNITNFWIYLISSLNPLGSFHPCSTAGIIDGLSNLQLLKESAVAVIRAAVHLGSRLKY